MNSTRGRFSARVITKSSKNTFRKLFSSHEVDAIILPPGTDFKINLENNYNGQVYCQIFIDDEYIGTWKLGPHKNGFVLNKDGKNQWFNFGRNIETIRIIFYPELPKFNAIEHNVFGQLHSIPLPPTSASNHFKKYTSYPVNKTFDHTALLPKIYNMPNNYTKFTSDLSLGPSYP
jgi:ribosomal protein S19